MFEAFWINMHGTIVLFLAGLGAKKMLFSYLQRLSICLCFPNLLSWLNCKKTLPCRAFCVEHATWKLHCAPVNKAQTAPISKTFGHTLILSLQQTLLFANVLTQFFFWGGLGSPHTTKKHLNYVWSRQKTSKIQEFIITSHHSKGVAPQRDVWLDWLWTPSASTKRHMQSRVP